MISYKKSKLKFDIEAGDAVALIGEADTGIRQFIEAICGFTNTDDEEIYIDGIAASRGNSIFKNQIVILNREMDDFCRSMNGYQIIAYLMNISGFGMNDRKVEQLSKQLGIYSVLQQNYHNFTQMDRIKILLLTAILKEPKILVLNDIYPYVAPLALINFNNLISDLYLKRENILIASGRRQEEFVSVYNKFVLFQDDEIINVLTVEKLEYSKFYHLTIEHRDVQRFIDLGFARSHCRVGYDTWGVEISDGNINDFLREIISNNILIRGLHYRNTELTGAI